MKFANEFIPGLTQAHFMELIYDSLCTFTVTRETCDDPGTFAFSVSDWKQDMHKVRLVMKKPRIEVLADLGYQCTCPDFSNLQQGWRVICDHIMISMEEVLEVEDDGPPFPEAWKRPKLMSSSAAAAAEEEERGNVWTKALQEADPADLSQRFVALHKPPPAKDYAVLFEPQA
ncbi:hypothetical protein BASA81_001850 [Batrachochytrium salamandrivorans]|nr:hypothetical protein BASA81_001850 [Batrachochytrium salamandrivorans]